MLYFLFTASNGAKLAGRKSSNVLFLHIHPSIHPTPTNSLVNRCLAALIVNYLCDFTKCYDLSVTVGMYTNSIHVFVLSVCCLFKGASLVCFISSAIVYTPHAVHVLRCLAGVNKLDNKLELCLPVRTREVEWKIENKHLRVFLFNNITPARASKGPPATSCVTVHQHFHVQSVKQRRNLIHS